MSPRLPAVPFRACVLAAAFACGPAGAATSPADEGGPEAPAARIRPVAGVLLTGTLGSNEATVANPDGSTATGSLSNRYEAFAGAEFPIDPNGLALRITAGMHATSSWRASGGGSEHVTSFPLEATLWYPLNDRLRAGLGARYALHTRFSGAGGKTSDGLSPAPALVGGIGVVLMPHLLLDLRYVYERYESGGDDVEASHWGLGLTGRW